MENGTCSSSLLGRNGTENADNVVRKDRTSEARLIDEAHNLEDRLFLIGDSPCALRLDICH